VDDKKHNQADKADKDALDEGIYTCALDWQAIQTKARLEYADIDNDENGSNEQDQTDLSLEYYHPVTKTWTLFSVQSLDEWRQQLLLARTTVPILLRLPSMYEDPDDNHASSLYSLPTQRMELAIWGLYSELRRQGYVQHDIGTMIRAGKGNEESTLISTREWILLLAETNTALEDLLLSQPGALDHLVECVHCDLVWRP
jgi:hypothetical protein